VSPRALLPCLVTGLALVLAGSTAPAGALSDAPLSLAPAASVSPQLHDPATGPPQSYPRHTELTEPPPDPGDAALALGLTAYHQIAPRLNQLQDASDRVSVEVIGTSAGGREIYLVTLTAPESPGQARRQAQLRRRILTQPQQAGLDPSLTRDYKVPVLLNANIHGDEWEGTDALLALVEDYAASRDPQVDRTLRHTRISVVVTMNPDGRVANTRSNDAGFDLNRDFITASQPETRAVRDVIVRTQPMLLLDLHGYVNGTLVDPTTPPHAQNIEADLMLGHAYPNALGVEQAILDLGLDRTDGVRPPQLPFRDWDEGWDGWPPIFTPQYAALHGAAATTIELPLRVNDSSYGLPAAELRRRTAINIEVADAAVRATLEYAVTHRQQLVADQIEWYRRGVTGADQVPLTSTDLPGAGTEDVYLTDYPRGYVIPVGVDQRSAPAAARLVDHLVANGVQVSRATRPVRVSGQTYPTGSYVVDLQQARRGVAGAILGPGTDLSTRVEAMYDISGWSLAQLWGADVVTVPDGTPLRASGPRVVRAAPTGELRGAGPWRLELLDPQDLAALNDLLAAGVEVGWTDDGAVLVPPSAAEVVARVVDEHGVLLVPAQAGAGIPLEAMRIAAAAPATERSALDEMGFDVTPVSPASLNDDFDWAQVDSLYVSDGLRWGDLDEQAQDELTAFLSDGGGLVTRGPGGTALNEALDALEVTTVAGRSDANGVVDVDSADTPIAAGATPQTFVYSPLWFTDLGAEVVVDQRYAVNAPLFSGHWRTDDTGAGGREDATGQALIVHGVDSDGATQGARVVLLGSEPLFRAHPKGQYALVARALIWSSLQD